MSEREILFRGQTRRKGEKVRISGEPVDSNWVYGGIFPGEGDFSIIYQAKPKIEKFTVYSDTVGQFTGLTDKNGTRIFEGDIIDVVYNPNYGGVAKERIGVRKVGFADGCYMYEDNEGYFLFTESDVVTVIGNIHDNPELLKGE